MPGPGQAADRLEDPKTIAWNLSALIVSYDQKSDTYIARGKVVITGGKTRLEADYVEFSNATKNVLARGNARLISGGDIISCDEMQVNLATETGWIQKGTIFVQKNHFYIHGENIRKTGKFIYSVEKGTITSCDGDIPDWKISGENVQVTIEGYGFATDTILWAKKMPVLYSPYLAFPVKTQRQTGLLIPSISSSDRLGFSYEQPFFWAISPSRDATLCAGYLSERGPRIAGEYRYVSDESSKGIWQMDFLSDDSTSERYWLRLKTDQALPHDFFAKLDLDVVSDSDFLLEFKDNLTGYDESNQVFQQQFGRDLDEYDDTVRRNSLTIERTWPQHALVARTLWYDNITARHTDIQDTTLQTLPGLEFSAVRQQIKGTGLYYAMDSQFKSFYRKDTVNTAASLRTAAKVNGQRLDINPTLFYPVKLGGTVSFQPFAGFRGTAYHTEQFTDINGDDDRLRFRGIYDMGADLSTRLNRVFTADTAFSDKIQHQVTPELSYHFLPHVDQEDLPFFDSLDDIEETNKLTWSLTNRFTARKTMTDPDGNTVNRYRELAWVQFFQDYDIRNERACLDAPGRPWSDIHMDTRIYPFSFLSMKNELAWSPYYYHFTELTVDTTLTDNRGDSVTTAYRYTIDATESWYTRFNIRINQTLSAFYSFELDLRRDRTIETRTGILLDRPCWAAGLDFKESGLDRRITFMISLKGIGEFSTR